MTPTVTPRALAAAVLLCGVALTAGCGAATQTSSSGQASTAPSTPAAPSTSQTAASPPAAPGSTTAPAVTGCTPSELKAKVNLTQVGVAAGSSYYPINFTNISNHTCTLYGYPGVSFVTGPSGSQIGKAAQRNSAVAATIVTLPPGGVAHATLQVASADNYSPSACQPVTAHWLRIFPPDQFSAIYASLTVKACSARHHIGSQISVYVIRNGPGRAGQGP